MTVSISVLMSVSLSILTMSVHSLSQHDLTSSFASIREPNSLAQYCAIPQRYVLYFMVSLILAITQISRTVLPLLVILPPHLNISTLTSCELEEPLPEEKYHEIEPKLAYSIDTSTQYAFIGSFYVAQFILLVPSGYLADKFGGKTLVTFGLFISAVFQLVTALVVPKTNSAYQIFLLRISQGLFESLIHPALFAVLVYWTPITSKNTVVGVLTSLSFLLTCLFFHLCHYLIIWTQTWTSVFFLCFGVTFLLTILWHLLCYSRPNRHPFISSSETNLFVQQLQGHVVYKKKSVPWGFIGCSGPLWALIVNETGHRWAWYTFFEHLHNYIYQVSVVHKMWLLTWVITCGVMVTVLTIGFCSDWLIYRKRLVSVTIVRKATMIFAAVGSATFFLVPAYAKCAEIKAVSSFGIAVILNGVHLNNIRVNALELAPNFTGIVVGVIFSSGSLMAALSPIIVGAITSQNPVEEWEHIFWITFFILVFCGIVFVIFGSGNERKWNKIKRKAVHFRS